MVERIGELVRDKRIEGICGAARRIRPRRLSRRDRAASATPCRTWCSTSSTASPRCRSTFGANMVALDGGRPLVMNLKDLLPRSSPSARRWSRGAPSILLGKARDRAHVLVGLAIAVANIDEVIRLIRAAKDANEAREAADGARLAGARRRRHGDADRRSAPQRVGSTAPRGFRPSRPRPSSTCACSG